MKRILSISLLSLVLLAGSRLSISAHYCMGKLVSVEFFKNSKACKKCGSNQKHHCCEDLTQTVSSEDFKHTSFHFDFFSEGIIPDLHLLSQRLVLPTPTAIAPCIKVHAPPYLDKEPLFVLFRQLIL